MASLAFVFPLRPGKTQEWRVWGEEIWEMRRSEYEAFRRKHGLTSHRRYLQHTPGGDQAIIYLEGDDLGRTFQELRTAQDPFTIWLRQRAQDLLDGLDVTQSSPESLSTLVFDGPSVEEDEASYQALEAMERRGMISPRGLLSPSHARGSWKSNGTTGKRPANAAVTQGKFWQIHDAISLASPRCVRYTIINAM